MVERRSPAPGKRSPPKKAPPSTPSRRRNSAVHASGAASANTEGAEASNGSATRAAATPTHAVSPETAPVAHSENSSTQIPVAVADQSPEEVKSASSVARVLDVFLIDSGWNTAVCSAVHDNVPAVAEYLKGHRFFVLNPDQSLAFIRRHPALVGLDPILLVLDRKAADSKNTAGCGFRLCLGHVRQPEGAISMLKWAVQLTMTASSLEMANIIRKSAHRESLQGAIELIGEGSTHLLEFAPV